MLIAIGMADGHQYRHDDNENVTEHRGRRPAIEAWRIGYKVVFLC